MTFDITKPAGFVAGDIGRKRFDTFKGTVRVQRRVEKPKCPEGRIVAQPRAMDHILRPQRG